jgi:hypothetical protein
MTAPKVGDVWVCSWGYDQTNVDYYVLTRVTAASVWIVPIGQRMVEGSEGFMSESVLPDPTNVLPWSQDWALRCMNDCGAPDEGQWRMNDCTGCHGPTERYLRSEDRAPRRKRLQSWPSDNGNGRSYYVTMTSYSSARPWSGTADYQSHYA